MSADTTLLPGVSSLTVKTSRLETHLLTAGSRDKAPVIFVHGNVSSSRFFEETLAALPADYYGLAPDMRGFGDSEQKPVDATRGVRDFADDLHALVEALELSSGGRKLSLIGWSAGAGVVMQYCIDHPELVGRVVLQAPGSPYGFGGTKGLEGTPCFDDFAGSGGGTANPEFVKRLAARDSSEENDASPRKVMNAFYFKPPFRAPKEREDLYVASMLSTRIDPGNYPGDMSTSPNWPTVAPGAKGMNNALSPKYYNLSAFAAISPRPPVLWIRGADDQIVSDTSLFDFGFLGQLGAVPGWPGAEVYPPQPMVSQTRAVLDTYKQNGGSYREVVFENCGHSPHIEHPERFREIVFSFLAGN